MYVYKKNNKFPHVILVPYYKYRSKVYHSDINPWCRENFGLYCEGWHCPAITYERMTTEENLSYVAPYAFKDELDAMAFMLRWI